MVRYYKSIKSRRPDWHIIVSVKVILHKKYDLKVFEDYENILST